MRDPLPQSDWRASKIRDWILAIVRYALTLEGPDEHTVLALAAELDGLGSVPGAAAFTFFRRASRDVCTAIAHPDDPNRTAILRRLLATISDRRLRQTTAAAIDLEGAQQARLSEARSGNGGKPSNAGVHALKR